MITEKNNVFYCDCGFFFERGRSGAHNCETGLRKKLAESEAKLSALAAENANCRNAVQVFCDVVDANTDAICEEVGQDGVKAILAAMSATGNMPATDAFLAEVRNEAGALAVELFAQTLGSPYSVRDEKCYEDGFTRAIEVVRDIQAPRFAYKIRQAGM